MKKKLKKISFIIFICFVFIGIYCYVNKFYNMINGGPTKTKQKLEGYVIKKSEDKPKTIYTNNKEKKIFKDDISKSSFYEITTDEILYSLDMKKDERKILKYISKIESGKFEIEIIGPQNEVIDVIKKNSMGSIYIEAKISGVYSVKVKANTAKGIYKTEIFDIYECENSPDIDLNYFKVSNYNSKIIYKGHSLSCENLCGNFIMDKVEIKKGEIRKIKYETSCDSGIINIVVLKPDNTILCSMDVKDNGIKEIKSEETGIYSIIVLGNNVVNGSIQTRVYIKEEDLNDSNMELKLNSKLSSEKNEMDEYCVNNNCISFSRFTGIKKISSIKVEKNSTLNIIFSSTIKDGKFNMVITDSQNIIVDIIKANEEVESKVKANDSGEYKIWMVGEEAKEGSIIFKFI